ncbi:hypothetical protein D9615_005872 [Tricholomella constricta]|uniref:DUF323 domain-containing protein n=1 Tax=Tricholomella constricta TaxID=117010 RepID=A0A8H5M343_9AGAR|nr:hypothetical protein D9615_005872 [Tricholomella constricta]
MSSPSSSSSLDSVFDHSSSRSTTPSSVDSDLSSHKPFGRYPSTCIYAPSTIIEPDVVKSLFDTYAQEGCFGLCLPYAESPQRSSLFVNWKETLLLAGGGRAFKIFVSPPTSSLTQDGDDMSIPTFIIPQVAGHLAAFSLAGLRAVVSTPRIGGYIYYTLERPTFSFPPLSNTPGFSVMTTPSKGNIPTLDDWKTVWSAWDLITLQMIPHEMLHQKPIDLRHKCLFYIGHIPTFLDMLLHKSIGGGASEPKHFWNIFERGIDPHVDDPDHCHNHSEVPEKDEDWPTLDTIIAFRNRVRARLAQLYDDLQSGKRSLTRNIARTLVMTHEHEGFHIETLLYMLIQRAGTGTLPPPGFISPPWEILTRQWDATPALAVSTVVLGPATVSLGQEDSEGDDSLEGISKKVDDHVFGWDNESPERKYEVGAFRVDWRPVSNREFETFWKESGADKSRLPGSWVEEDGEIKVRTMYGPVSMEIAQHWPVLTSYDDLLAYAHSKGGRLPTEMELRLFLDTYEVGHEGGSNTGFRNWHPVPATTGLESNDGKGSNGGVWEWTSTLFDTHPGLSPTNLFTGYSTDFFDTKHHVVLGASYATIPRLASRRTVRNFYQHNYPYPWVGGRVVYDA